MSVRCCTIACAESVWVATIKNWYDSAGIWALAWACEWVGFVICEAVLLESIRVGPVVL